MTVNLFRDLPASLPQELTEVLHSAPGLRIERIVSTGHASPPGVWYDQAEHEWLVLLRGDADLRFDDDPAPHRLGPGDTLFLPARRRHRVERTSSTEPTVWLAVFYAAG